MFRGYRRNHLEKSCRLRDAMRATRALCELLDRKLLSTPPIDLVDR